MQNINYNGKRYNLNHMTSSSFYFLGDIDNLDRLIKDLPQAVSELPENQVLGIYSGHLLYNDNTGRSFYYTQSMPQSWRNLSSTSRGFQYTLEDLHTANFELSLIRRKADLE